MDWEAMLEEWSKDNNFDYEVRAWHGRDSEIGRYLRKKVKDNGDV